VVVDDTTLVGERRLDEHCSAFVTHTPDRVRTNLQSADPEIVLRLTALLERYRKTGRSR